MKDLFDILLIFNKIVWVGDRVVGEEGAGHICLIFVSTQSITGPTVCSQIIFSFSMMKNPSFEKHCWHQHDNHTSHHHLQKKRLNIAMTSTASAVSLTLNSNHFPVHHKLSSIFSHTNTQNIVPDAKFCSSRYNFSLSLSFQPLSHSVCLSVRLRVSHPDHRAASLFIYYFMSRRIKAAGPRGAGTQSLPRSSSSSPPSPPTRQPNQTRLHPGMDGLHASVCLSRLISPAVPSVRPSVWLSLCLLLQLQIFCLAGQT